MKTVIVVRHIGAKEWIAKHHSEFSDVEQIAQAKPEDLKGNRVIGVLPIHLAALCAEYWHLEMNIPQEARGKELSCEDMETFGCKISQFEVRRILPSIFKHP